MNYKFKKYNVAFVLLTMVYYHSIAQPIQYDNNNVDSIIIKSAYGTHNMKRFYTKEDVYILYYDTAIDNFKIGGYIKTEQINKHKKQKIIKKYDIQSDIKEKIQNLLFAIEDTSYKPVYLSDFNINENNIVSIIDSTIQMYKEYYYPQRFKKDYIQECKNIDTFRLFLTEHYSKRLLKEYRHISSRGSRFSIYIKTALNTYYIWGSTFYKSQHPWNKFNEDLKYSTCVRMINFNINKSLLEILPKDFFNITNLTEIGVIQDYIEWYVYRKECEYYARQKPTNNQTNK